MAIYININKIPISSRLMTIYRAENIIIFMVGKICSWNCTSIPFYILMTNFRCVSRQSREKEKEKKRRRKLYHTSLKMLLESVSPEKRPWRHWTWTLSKDKRCKMQPLRTWINPWAHYRHACDNERHSLKYALTTLFPPPPDIQYIATHVANVYPEIFKEHFENRIVLQWLYTGWILKKWYIHKVFFKYTKSKLYYSTKI